MLDSGCNRVVLSRKFVNENNFQHLLVKKERLVNTAQSTEKGEYDFLENVTFLLDHPKCLNFNLVSDAMVLNNV